MCINTDRWHRSQGRIHGANSYCESWHRCPQNSEASAIFAYEKIKKMDELWASCFGVRVWDVKGLIRPEWFMGLVVVHSGEGDRRLVYPSPTTVSDNFARWRGQDRQTKNETRAIPYPPLPPLPSRAAALWCVRRKIIRFLPLLKFRFKNKKNNDFLILNVNCHWNPCSHRLLGSHTFCLRKKNFWVHFQYLSGF